MNMKRAKWWMGWLAAGLVVWLTGSASGQEGELFQFRGGHPWLSRERIVSIPPANDERETVEETTSLAADEVDVDKIMHASISPKVVDRQDHQNPNGANGTGRIFDITVSMYKHRTAEERKKIEEIFKYFAWGVYEATEGIHRIGTVRIYEQSGMSADIVWGDRGGVETEPFDRIYMFDYATGNDDDYFSSQTYRALAGFTLAHEWGHFKYGFGDEYDFSYKGKLIHQEDQSVEPALMGVTRNALKNGFHPEWLNLSIRYDPTNERGPYRNTQRTVQHRLYSQSCLEQLVHPRRPAKVLYYDWWNPVLLDTSYFLTIDYPEFSIIDPTQEPRIDLTAAGKIAATNELKVIWPDEPKLVWAICLDHSGSMSNGDLELAKARTKLAIDQAPEGTLVGIFAFASGVDTIVPFTDVTAANRASLKSSVDAFSPGGGTALWRAAYEALGQMEALDPEHNNLGSLLLMTDGEDNASGSITRAMVVAKCLEMNVAFNSIAYGQNADAQSLKDVAEATGGKNVSASDSLLSVNDAFNRLLSYGSCRMTISDAKGTTSDAGTWTETFSMDSSGTDMQVTATLSVPFQSATVAFVSPTGIRYEANSRMDVGSESSFIFSQLNPEPGNWMVSVAAPAGTKVSCYADVSASKVPPRLRVWPDDGNSTIYASVSYGAPVNGSVVKALIDEGETTREVPFEAIGAGIYKLNLTDCGIMGGGVTVRADAENGVATYTYIGSMDYMGDDEGEPIAESFTRSEWVALGKENAVTFYTSGKGKLEFQWRTSGEGVPGRIDFLCNGNTTATLGSGQGWTKKEIVSDEEGTHVFQWVTPSGVRKFTGPWLQNVIWHPVPEVEMGGIQVTPRWPWNGMVDIDFAFTPTLAGTKATFAVSGVDEDLGNTIEAKTLTGEYRNLAAGTHRVTWDLGADAPGFHSSAFTVQLDATVEPLPAPVVRIGRSTASGGNLLQWDGATPSATYTVFRGTNASGAGAAVIGTVQPGIGEEPSFLDSTAPNGRTVWYAVESSAWKIGGGRSTWVSARRPMLPPTKLAATDGTRTDGVSVTWTPSAGTVKSRVYRCASGASWQNNSFTWGNPIVETTNTSWFDSTVVPGAAYAYAVACVSAEREASSLPKLSSENGLFDLGWRNMKAPIFTSTMRTNWVEYGYAPWEQLHWYKNYWCYSKYSIAWNPVEGAQSYLVDHWCDDASAVSIVTNSVTVTECTFEYLDARSTPSSNRIWYRPPRTFRVTPIRDHQGLSTEVTVE